MTLSEQPFGDRHRWRSCEPFVVVLVDKYFLEWLDHWPFFNSLSKFCKKKNPTFPLSFLLFYLKYVKRRSERSPDDNWTVDTLYSVHEWTSQQPASVPDLAARAAVCGRGLRPHQLSRGPDRVR